MGESEKNFALEIKRLRKEKKLSQEKLADLMCMDRRRYWEVENGKFNINVGYLQKIAMFYGIEIAVTIHGDGRYEIKIML